MTASKTKHGVDKITTKPINSIHIVVFACPNCGEEFEELRLCKECKSPMRVVQVIEKFGSEASEYLAKLKKSGVWDETSVRPSKDDDGGYSSDEELLDDSDIKISGITEEKAEDDELPVLEDIFEDDDNPKPARKIDEDFASAIAGLDEEDSGVDDIGDVPEL